ncbi:hypothetical protein LVY72_04195 [Arthrobacter sp. I2-34]|uniref:Uncharacterized protein n=1 Tax=Arthrobacter hankyongi TaxID=2904801 RepID=A0ABS9L397_9MICC|nr:hypothetical protein [Arthrobacter hankyongi]MCG2621114.1 hypothetical protein [Arthrobacter hankyongi]
MAKTLPADTQDRLQQVAALLSATTTQLLEHPVALDRAPDLLDLHTADVQVRLHLDQAHQDVPDVLVTDRPAVLLDEAIQLLDALPEHDRAALHGPYLVLVRAAEWAGDLG